MFFNQIFQVLFYFIFYLYYYVMSREHNIIMKEYYLYLSLKKSLFVFFLIIKHFNYNIIYCSKLNSNPIPLSSLCLFELLITRARHNDKQHYLYLSLNKNCHFDRKIIIKDIFIKKTYFKLKYIND